MTSDTSKSCSSASGAALRVRCVTPHCRNARLIQRSGSAPSPSLCVVTDEALAAEAPFSPTDNPDETIGSLLAGLSFHEAYHAGQIGLLRRIVGKQGALGSPRPEAATA